MIGLAVATVVLLALTFWWYKKRKNTPEEGIPTSAKITTAWTFYTSPLIFAVDEAATDKNVYTYTFTKQFTLDAPTDLTIAAAGIEKGTMVYLDDVVKVTHDTPLTGSYPVVSLGKVSAGTHTVKVVAHQENKGNGFALSVYTTDPAKPILDTKGTWNVTKVAAVIQP